MSEFHDLDGRSREIFQKVVEGYIRSGEPMGSRSISQNLSEDLSPATIRNVMSRLEQLGLLGSPHISAGRLPTELGLRFFVDGILEMKSLPLNEQKKIDSAIQKLNIEDANSSSLLERTSRMLSDISKTASLVFSKEQVRRVKHVDFVSLSPDQALVILVDEQGHVDNRLFTPPIGLSASDMKRAANFINAQIDGQTLAELRNSLEDAVEHQQKDIDETMAHLIEIGRGVMVEDSGLSQFVVRGRSNLIDEAQNDEQIELLRQLMDDLESKRGLLELLELSDEAQAVRVFIGSENKLFSLKSSSLVLSPYMNGEGQIIGAVGVIGPTRLNYARIVPLVSYTANRIGKFFDSED